MNSTMILLNQPIYYFFISSQINCVNIIKESSNGTRKYFFYLNTIYSNNKENN